MMFKKKESIKKEEIANNLYLIFCLNSREFGIDIVYLNEIIALLPVSPLTDVPDYVKGVINLKEKIIPVIDMRLRLKIPEIPYHDRTCILIIKIEEQMVGLIVDSVKEVLKISKDKLKDTPIQQGKSDDALSDHMIESSGSIVLILNLKHIIENIDFKHGTI